MKFEDKDFKGLTWNIHGADEKAKITELIPTIKLYNEFKGLKDIRVIKYIVYLYDSKTPFKSIDNFTTRKKQAAELAGFKVDDKGNYQDKYDKIISGKDKQVNKMAIRYCRIQRSPQFAKLVIFEESYYNELLILKDDDGLKAADREKTLKNINTMASQIEELTGRFLSGDDNPVMKMELFDEIENEELQLTPEDIALKYEAGENPLGNYNPYE